MKKTMIIGFAMLCLALQSQAKVATAPQYLICAGQNFLVEANFKNGTFKMMNAMDKSPLFGDRISKTTISPSMFETSPAQKEVVLNLKGTGIMKVNVYEGRLKDEDGTVYEKGFDGSYQGMMSNNEKVPFSNCELIY